MNDDERLMQLLSGAALRNSQLQRAHAFHELLRVKRPAFMLSELARQEGLGTDLPLAEPFAPIDERLLQIYHGLRGARKVS